MYQDTNKSVAEFRPELQLLTDLGKFIYIELELYRQIHTYQLLTKVHTHGNGHLTRKVELYAIDYIFSNESEIPSWIGTLSKLGKF